GAADTRFAGDIHKDVVIEFRDHGVTVARLSKADLLARLPSFEKRIYEYLEDGQEKDGSTPENPQAWVTFGLLPAGRVLDLAYGASWRKGGKILFTCVDNYKPVVPVSRFLEQDGLFAVYRASDPSFRLRNRADGNKIVPLGPLYLTWDRMEDPAVLKDGKISIPYQIMGVNLVDEDYGKLAVSADASQPAKRGAQAFERYCSRCHQISGDGRGERGADLTFAAERYAGREGVLAQKIRDPRIQVPDSTMTPLTATIADPAELDGTIDDVIAFLKQAAQEARAPR
ncbi:MAG TPA: c-type cytochrome, partial [Bdellovibrionota bacterium]|nr:c-type cytochrome [Bdellovibrionota bacterium]